MKRVKIEPRKDYEKKIESLGFNFHTNYWKENAYYSFTLKEIEEIETASKECYWMYCKAVQYMIDNNRLDELFIPKELQQSLIDSWNNDDLSLYGRFDFALIQENGKLVPKLLEFNADTPTSLLEASVIQWDWIKERFPNNDQFNSIHDALVTSWKDIHKEYNFDMYHFACNRDNVEDEETTQYLVATAMEAGLSTSEIEMEQLGYDEDTDAFWDPSDTKIECCFKLYPWEWLMSEDPDSIKGCSCKNIKWIEPIWKAAMSNKAILTVMYELFPDSPYILKCKYNPVALDDFNNYCKKPIFSREGANIELYKDGKLIESSTDEGYGEEGYIYQEFVDIPKFDEKFPIIGSWIIGGEACGIGIRETSSRITDNMSEFIPHIIEN